MRSRSVILLAALATLPVALPAAAEGYHPRGDYERGIPRVAYGRGFAQPFVAGEYIGAPFTTVPSPNRIVPAPWSYGTYGVPTASGIAAAPTGAPTLTVIVCGSNTSTGVTLSASVIPASEARTCRCERSASTRT